MASDAALSEWLSSMSKAVGTAQAHTMVQHFILRDIVIQLAALRDEPEAFIAAMFERVSGLVDQCELAGKPEIESEMRWYTDSFFTSAGKAVVKS
ncbi:hypothetical protein EZH22_21490 [Xanthobacter dioxanivorans]|uniref:Uncharacterized protein n=1 Tax=Xanthobacter dioxanivorans TaxID=2528964 RepID=A0A974PL96_9HYPH|nr:hypothetical protein [Xanthobacter dioxanivorans]QRG05609.1 hypothetical protein EZH22_21490 [Xanthobacter dioxanivorans]